MIILFDVSAPAEASFESFMSRLEKAPEDERAAIVTEYLQTAEVPVVEGTSGAAVQANEHPGSLEIEEDSAIPGFFLLDSGTKTSDGVTGSPTGFPNCVMIDCSYSFRM